MKKTIYALGFFDGVHLGHAALLKQCQTLARQHDCLAGVVTFGTHPEALVCGRTPALINTPGDREKLLLQRFSMDHVVTLPFDDALRSMSWQDFADMLCRDYHAAGFVCGEDFRFGHKGQGDAALLRQYCSQRDLPFAAVPQQILQGLRISSTHIRQLLQRGAMAEATVFLGHPHILSGKVVHGHQLGRRLGIPTANLRLPEGLLIPPFGVYACRAIVDGVRYPAVTNIGTRPTVSGEGITVEPWILNYSGDLYDREITLEFYDWLRPEEKFPDLQSLQEAIHRDAQKTLALLDAVP